MVPPCGFFFPLNSSSSSSGRGHRGVGGRSSHLSYFSLALALLGICLCSLTGTVESQMRQEANSPLYPGMSSSSLPSSSTSDGHPALVRRNFLRFGKRSAPPATFMQDRVLRSGGQASLDVNGGPFRRDYREFVRFGKRSSGDALDELLALESGRAKRVREPVIASDNRMVLPEDEEDAQVSESEPKVSEEEAEEEGARAAALAMQQQQDMVKEQKRRDDFLRFGKRLLRLNNLLCSESGLCDGASSKPSSLKQQQLLQLRQVQQRLRQLREFDPAYLAKKSNDFLRFGRR